MVIPSVIGPIDSGGNPPDGIINAIRNTYSISNPITEGIVVPTASSTQYGTVGNVVMWNSTLWSTPQMTNPYLQLEFPKRLLFITGYSLKGHAGNSYCYQKSWRVEGFNKGEEEYPSKWTLISQNTAAEKNFCGCSTKCNSKAIVTYKTAQQSKGFQYIRWTAESTYCSASSVRFLTAGIEVYGKLTTSSGEKKKICTCFLYRAPLISPAFCVLFMTC